MENHLLYDDSFYHFNRNLQRFIWTMNGFNYMKAKEVWPEPGFNHGGENHFWTKFLECNRSASMFYSCLDLENRERLYNYVISQNM